MNVYAMIVLLILIVTLLYTYKNDTSIFLFTLLLVSICLYINDIVSNSFSLVKNDIIKDISKIVHINR